MIHTPKTLQNYIFMFGSISGYFDTENQNHLDMSMQFLSILWLVIYFGQGKNLYIYNHGWRKEKFHVCDYLLFYSSILIYYMYILLVLCCIVASIHVHSILCVHTFKQIELLEKTKDS
jgi:sensor histidine kinase YesM